MKTSRIPIEQYVESKIITNIEIEVINYNINVSAVCNESFYNPKDEKVSNILVYIENDDFNLNWNSDDDLINIVCRKLGLTRQKALLDESPSTSSE